GLRGYGQRDPLVEYKKESFALFRAMKQRVDEETVRYLWRLRPVFSPARAEASPSAPAAKAAAPTGIFSPPRPSQMQENRRARASPRSAARARGRQGGISGSGAAVATPPAPARVGGDDAAVRTVRRDEPKVGRNDPCPCGSGKKYKKCHGAGQRPWKRCRPSPRPSRGRAGCGRH